MIVNIHGYHGKGYNSKYNWLKEHFPTEKIISPDFDYDSSPIVGSLAKIRQDMFNNGFANEDRKILIATSMGCFNGMILHNYYDFDKVIFISPCFMPFLHIEKEWLRDTEILKYYTKLFHLNFFNWDNEDVDELNKKVHVIYGWKDEAINHVIETLPLFPFGFKNLYSVNSTHNIHIEGEVEKIMLDILTK